MPRARPATWPSSTRSASTPSARSWRRPRDLATALEEALGGSPTVLVQADNTWRTLATALAVGLRGGMVAVLSSHAVAAEFELAMEDIEPDAVVASDDVLEHWAVSSEAFPDKRAALDGWALVTSGGRSVTSAAGPAASRSR